MIDCPVKIEIVQVQFLASLIFLPSPTSRTKTKVQCQKSSSNARTWTPEYFKETVLENKYLEKIASWQTIATSPFRLVGKGINALGDQVGKAFGSSYRTLANKHGLDIEDISEINNAHSARKLITKHLNKSTINKPLPSGHPLKNSQDRRELAAKIREIRDLTKSNGRLAKEQLDARIISGATAMGLGYAGYKANKAYNNLGQPSETDYYATY